MLIRGDQQVETRKNSQEYYRLSHNKLGKKSFNVQTVHLETYLERVREKKNTKPLFQVLISCVITVFTVCKNVL